MKTTIGQSPHGALRGRRGVLGGSVALGATAIAGGLAASAIAADRPDADLIEACASFLCLDEREAATFELGLDDNETRLLAAPIQAEIDALIDRLAHMHAQTAVGIHARARFAAEFNRNNWSSWEEGQAKIVLDALFRDALALPVPGMPPSRAPYMHAEDAGDDAARAVVPIATREGGDVFGMPAGETVPEPTPMSRFMRAAVKATDEQLLAFADEVEAARTGLA